MVNWIALPVLILNPNLIGQTYKLNSGILQSSQLETVNLWEDPAPKSFGFVIRMFCGISMCKIYTLKEYNTRRIDKSEHMFYGNGRWWKKKNKKWFFLTFFTLLISSYLNFLGLGR